MKQHELAATARCGGDQRRTVGEPCPSAFRQLQRIRRFALVLHEHLERLVGVDITADFSQNPKAVTAYMAPALEIYSQGVFTETTVQLMREAFVDASRQNTEKEEA